MFYCLSISFPVQRQYDVLIRPPIVHLDLEPCVAPGLVVGHGKPADRDHTSARLGSQLVGYIEVEGLEFPFLSITSRLRFCRAPPCRV